MPASASTPQRLWQDPGRGLDISATGQPGAEAIALLEAIRFGSTGLRYRRLDMARQLQRLPAASFVELRQHGNLIGTYAVGRAALVLGGMDVQGVYRGGLALHPDARGQKLAGELVARTLDWLAQQALADAAPTLAWGCIETGNQPSLALLARHGAAPVGELESQLVYRQWPRARVDVQVLGSREGQAIQTALNTAQADCALRPLRRNDGEYFAVTANDRIVAGATASATRIDLLTSGAMWELYARLVRFLPPARRRFDPHDFRYLQLSDVVVTPGHEHVWPDLLATLLARHRMHMAMFLLDPRSRTYRLLDSAGLFGRFAAGTRQSIKVMAHGWNLPAGALESLADRPIATGPLDA